MHGSSLGTELIMRGRLAFRPSATSTFERGVLTPSLTDLASGDDVAVFETWCLARR
jgi:hypothetical protein